ncbi:MAG: MFS transporter [Chloroflexi bacterium]|nr:MFS transporter [Chloroflexota bacterium]
MASLYGLRRPTRRFHYAWVILGILAVVQIFGQSISMSAGIMIPELREPLAEGGKFGWPVGLIGAALAGYYLVGSLTSPYSGRLGDTLGARKLLVAGGILFGTSMILIGFITHIWQFFIVYSVMLALTSSITIVPLMAAVNPWFKRRLGLGIGLMWAAGGLGAALLAPVYSILLEQFGWTTTFVCIGAVGGGITLLLVPFFRNQPAEKGLLAYGASPHDKPAKVFSQEAAKVRLQIFQKQMRHTRAFWNLPVIHGLGCAGHGIVLIYVIDYAVKEGVLFTTAAIILTLIQIFSIAGRFAVPIITERIGGKPIMATALAIQALSVGLLLLPSGILGYTANVALPFMGSFEIPLAFFLFGMVFGLGFGGEMSAYPVVNRQYYGTGPVGSVYGMQISGAMMGHCISTVAAGFIIQFLSFGHAFLLSMAFSGLGVIIIMTLETTKRELIPNWEDQLPAEARTAPPPTMVPPAAAATGVAFGSAGGDGN